MRKSLTAFGLILAATALVTSQVTTESPRKIASLRPTASTEQESRGTIQATQAIEELKSSPVPLAGSDDVAAQIPCSVANVPLVIETDELPRRPRSASNSEIKGFDFKDVNFRDLGAELDLGVGRRDLGLYVPAE